MQHFKTEHFIPTVTDRYSYDGWISRGGRSLLDRAGDEVRRIFKEHTVEPVPKEVSETANELLKKRAGKR
jgi:trimethylamine:corrinoid methyltransferase-like protein